MPVTKYVWDVATDSYLMETDENDATTAVYTNEPGQFGPAISQRRGGDSHFFHRDGLGSVVDVTDAAEDPTDGYVYKAYGEIAASTGSTVNPFRWVGSLGYYYDLDLLQFYIRARHYDPRLARFLSQDPIAHRAGISQYGYANGAPIRLIDPLGTMVVPNRPPLPKHMPKFLAGGFVVRPEFGYIFRRPVLLRWVRVHEGGAYNQPCLSNCAHGRMYCYNSSIKRKDCNRLYKLCKDYCKSIKNLGGLKHCYLDPRSFPWLAAPSMGVAAGVIVAGKMQFSAAKAAWGKALGLGGMLLGGAWEVYEAAHLIGWGVAKAKQLIIKLAYRRYGESLDPLRAKGSEGAAYGTTSTGVFLDFAEAGGFEYMGDWQVFWITPCERKDTVFIYYRDGKGVWRKTESSGAGQLTARTCLYADEVFRIEMYMAFETKASEARGEAIFPYEPEED